MDEKNSRDLTNNEAITRIGEPVTSYSPIRIRSKVLEIVWQIAEPTDTAASVKLQAIYLK